MDNSASKRVIPYVAILVIACYLYYVASQIGTAGDGRIGADFWPKTILMLTIVTCVWKIAEHFYQSPRTNNVVPNRTDVVAEAELEEKSESMQADRGVSRWTPWIGIGTAVAYVLLLDKLGYFMSTFLFGAAFMYLGNYRRITVVIPLALIASLTSMLLFMKAVYIALPLGVGPFSLISTFLIKVMGIR